MTAKEDKHQLRKSSKQEIDPNEANETGSATDGRETRISQLINWQGPLPPPQALEDYDRVVKNGAERVFKQFEREGNHRRDMEKLHLNAQIRDLMIGKFFAFIFVMSIVGMGVYAVSQQASVVGGAVVFGALASVVWAFVKVTGESGSQRPKNIE
jgi:uncharacterized membrane protein